MKQSICLAAGDLPRPGEQREYAAGGFRVVHEVLAEGRSRGVERLSIWSRGNVVRLLPTRGMGIEDATIDGIRFGWDSPVRGPVHPVWVPLGEPGGLGWLEGFTELMVRCGLGNNGAPYHDGQGRLVWPLHGRIANQPAIEVEFGESGDGSLDVHCVVEECRMHFWKWRMAVRYRMEPGLRRVVIEDTVTNGSSVADRFQNLYHYNLGAPLLEPGAQVFVPARRVVPRDEHSAGRVREWNRIWEPVPGDFERVYFIQPAFDGEGVSMALLRNAAGTAGTVLEFREQDGLRCLTLWKNLVGEGEGYVIGLEPGTNWPNNREFEVGEGRCLELAPGASWTMGVEIGFLTSPEAVAAEESRCRAIWPDDQTAVESTPLPGICAIQKLAWDSA